MKLKELATPFETKQVITYASNGNDVVYRKLHLQHITDNIYLDKSYRIYVCYPDCPVGLYIIQANEDTSIESIIQYIKNNQLETPEQFLLMIEKCLQKEIYIKNTMIEFLKYIAPDKIKACVEAKARILKRQEQERKEQEEKERQEELAYVQQKNEEAEQIVQKSIQILKNGGILINSEIIFYKGYYDYSTYHIINHLARLYDIAIPLKTQGWINTSLAQIKIQQDGEVTEYKVFHGSNSSKVIFKYLNQLVAAARL